MPTQFPRNTSNSPPSSHSSLRELRQAALHTVVLHVSPGPQSTNSATNFAQPLEARRNTCAENMCAFHKTSVKAAWGLAAVGLGLTGYATSNIAQHDAVPTGGDMLLFVFGGIALLFSACTGCLSADDE